MPRWHRVSMTFVRCKSDKNPSFFVRTREMTMNLSSLPVFACWLSNPGERAARIERTLERINVKALVVPIEFFLF
jgi:hypothetical protein